MYQVFLVGVGGGLGAVARYVTKQLTYILFPNAFPLGTFLVNVIGSFILGAGVTLSGEGEWISTNAQLLLFSGLLSSYTTFSSYSVESLELLQKGRTVLSGSYAVGSVVVCLIGAWSGFRVVRWGL